MQIWSERRIQIRKAGIFVLLVIIAIVLGIPYHLKNMPLIIGSDGMEQIEMAMGDLPISNHHPVTFILFLKLILRILDWIGLDMIHSLFVFSCLQSVLLSALFSLIALWCYKITGNKMLSVVTYLFLVLPPFQGMYSITLWKDIWYAMFCAAFFLALYQRISVKKNVNGFLNSLNWIILFVFGICVCCLRNNAIYAFLILPLVCYVLYRNRKGIIVMLVCVILASFAIKTIENKCVVKEFDGIESSISIPLQNIGYLLANDYEIPSSDLKLINDVINVESAKKEYIPYLADPMKELFAKSKGGIALKERVGDYFSLWSGLGIKYPLAYLKSWYGQTSGYYIPNYQFRVNIEGIPEGGTYGLKAIDNRSVLIKKLNDFYSLIWDRFPFAVISWASVYTWLVIASLIIAFAQKNRPVVIIDLFLTAYLITLFIAVPVNADFRYVYSFVLLLPVILALLVSSHNTETSVRG